MQITGSRLSLAGVRKAPVCYWLAALSAVALLYSATFFDLFHTIWSTEEQGHGPIVLGLSLWLLYQKSPQLMAITGMLPRPSAAWPILMLSIFLYVFGRSQGVLIFEVGSIVVMLIGITLLLSGFGGLKIIWFALFFMLFMVPLPSPVVDALTQPMKLAVSNVADNILFKLGYPISRSGVILNIGNYQLMVADACAGLHTLFTLEALGLLYLNIVRTASAFRNIGLAVLIVPISFSANVIRVMTLTLITYYFGDEAGQGFLHGFAGMVLFMSALILIISTDGLLRLKSSRIPKARLG